MIAEDEAHARGDARREALLGGVGGVAQAAGGVVEDLNVRGRGALLRRVCLGITGGCPLHEPSALFEHELHVHAGAELDGGVVVPRGVRVGPRVDTERPVARRVRGDPCLVAVQTGGDVDHARAGVLTPVRGEEDGFGGERVVSFAEHGCADGERLAFGRLSGKRSVLDDGKHFNDRDTGQQVLAHRSHTSLLARANESAVYDAKRPR